MPMAQRLRDGNDFRDAFAHAGSFNEIKKHVLWFSGGGEV